MEDEVSSILTPAVIVLPSPSWWLPSLQLQFSSPSHPPISGTDDNERAVRHPNNIDDESSIIS